MMNEQEWSEWWESVYPVMEPFKARVVTAWKQESDMLKIFELLKLPSEMIQECRKANIEWDEVMLLDKFAHLIFQHLAG